jgi:hypothetical protein
MAKKNKIGIGIAGEALVEARLAQMGYIVGVTRKNTPRLIYWFPTAGKPE